MGSRRGHRRRGIYRSLHRERVLGSGFLVPRVHTLGADYTADRSRKVNQRVLVRKENAQDPASVRGQKAKAMQRMKMTNPTQLSGEKENSKEKAKRARKE